MRNVLIFVGFLAIALQANADEFKLISDEGNEYLIETADHRLTWYEAEEYCEHMDKQLVAIETKEKQKEIGSMLRKNFTPELLSKMRFWTSGSNHIPFIKTNFVWISSFKEFNYVNWFLGGPGDKLRDEQCVELRGSDFLWNYLDCDNHHGYICQAQSKNYKEIARAKEYQRKKLIKEFQESKKEIQDIGKQIEKKTAQLKTEHNELEAFRKVCEEGIMNLIEAELQQTNFIYSLPTVDLERSDKHCIYKKLAELAGI